jgi:hypothetical protein
LHFLFGLISLLLIHEALHLSHFFLFFLLCNLSRALILNWLLLNRLLFFLFLEGDDLLLLLFDSFYPFNLGGFFLLSLFVLDHFTLHHGLGHLLLSFLLALEKGLRIGHF